MINQMQMLDGRAICGKIKKGRDTFVVLESGEEISCIQVSKVLIFCEGTKKWFERPLRWSFWNKKWQSSKNHAVMNNGFKGKTHSKETKKNHSEFMKGRFVGKDNPFFGKSHSDETRKILSEKCGRFGEENGFYGKHHTEKVKQAASRRMKGFASANPMHFKEMGIISATKRPKKTNPERKTETKLLELGFDISYSKRIGDAQFDFRIGNSILLEVHGDYWHANPLFYGEGKRPYTQRQLFKIARDKEKAIIADTHGYSLYVIWEHAINNGDWSVLEEIQNELNKI